MDRMQKQGTMNQQLFVSFPDLKKVERKEKEVQEDALSKIEEAFMTVDINKDGTLTADELAQTTKKLGLNWDEKMCDEVISQIDLDGVGHLNMFDFAHVVGAAVNRNPNGNVEDILRDSLNSLMRKRAVKKQMREQGLKNKMNQILRKFKQLDKDKDGGLDIAEFTAAVKSFNLDWSDDEIKDCLSKIDSNNSGKIEKAEFSAAFYNAAMKNPDLPIDEIITCALGTMMSKGA